MWLASGLEHTKRGLPHKSTRLTILIVACLPFLSGSHPGGLEQVAVDRRRDLGQDHRAGAEPPGGQGLRQGARPHSQRIGRRLRRVSNRTVGLREPDAGFQNRRGQATHWPGEDNV